MPKPEPESMTVEEAMEAEAAARGIEPELPPSGFEMTDDEYNDFASALQVKVKEDGGKSGDPSDLNLSLKRWWKLLIDLPEAKKVKNKDQLKRLKAARKEQDDTRAAMDAEITTLEGKINP